MNVKAAACFVQTLMQMNGLCNAALHCMRMIRENQNDAIS